MAIANIQVLDGPVRIPNFGKHGGTIYITQLQFQLDADTAAENLGPLIAAATGSTAANLGTPHATILGLVDGGVSTLVDAAAGGDPGVTMSVLQGPGAGPGTLTFRRAITGASGVALDATPAVTIEATLMVLV